MHTTDHTPLPDEQSPSRLRSGGSIALGAAVTAAAPALAMTGSLLLCALAAVATLASVAAATVMI
jgi:hypothetical protein